MTVTGLSKKLIVRCSTQRKKLTNQTTLCERIDQIFHGDRKMSKTKATKSSGQVKQLDKSQLLKVVGGGDRTTQGGNGGRRHQH